MMRAINSAQKIFQTITLLGKVRGVLILDYGITTMFANTQWFVSGINLNCYCFMVRNC